MTENSKTDEKKIFCFAAINQVAESKSVSQNLILKDNKVKTNMIIIKTTDVQSEIKIPTIYSKSVNSGLYTIRLENTSTHFNVSFSNVADYSDNPLYYSFFINTSGIEKGEYEYEVLDDEQYSVALGLLRIEKEKPLEAKFKTDKEIKVYKSKLKRG